jgi:glycosyltransferase involved in cell wall biosynthesis
MLVGESSMGYAVTIVVPTFNRRARLQRVLSALEQQAIDRSRFEVVVVDDGSSDGTADWLRGQKFGFALRVIEQANQGPAAARNAGVANAQGQLVLFLDDDVVPGPDLVAEHLKMHEAEKDIVVTGPMSSLPRYEQPWVAWEQAKLEAQYRAMIRGDYAPSFRQFWTGNASLAKRHFVEAGGFDVSCKRGEDVELGQRLDARGLSFRFNPAAVGWHHAERSLESWSAAHRSYGALEVEIFRRLGRDSVEQVLSANYRRLHPLNRLLVRGCVGQKGAFFVVTSVIKSYLKLSQEVGQPEFAGAACGALANLLYWQASREALGTEALEKVFRLRADGS